MGTAWTDKRSCSPAERWWWPHCQGCILSTAEGPSQLWPRWHSRQGAAPLEKHLQVHVPPPANRSLTSSVSF